MIHLIINPLV